MLIINVDNYSKKKIATEFDEKFQNYKLLFDINKY